MRCNPCWFNFDPFKKINLFPPALWKCKTKLLDYAFNSASHEMVWLCERVLSHYFLTSVVYSDLVNVTKPVKALIFKVATLLNAVHASCLTCLNLNGTSNRPWVCALQVCDWLTSPRTQIDRQTGARPPALSEAEYTGRLWLIMATWLLTVSFRRAVKSNQNKLEYDYDYSGKVKECPSP